MVLGTEKYSYFNFVKFYSDRLSSQTKHSLTYPELNKYLLLLFFLRVNKILRQKSSCVHLIHCSVAIDGTRNICFIRNSPKFCGFIGRSVSRNSRKLRGIPCLFANGNSKISSNFVNFQNLFRQFSTCPNRDYVHILVLCCVPVVRYVHRTSYISSLFFKVKGIVCF
jgi:hypothetical protein